MNFVQFKSLNQIAVLMALSACSRGTDPIIIVEETSLHVRAAWSPDGLTIAFTNQIVGSQGIYLVDSSGSNLRLLKAGEGLGLSWSPDAQWIVFSANGSLHKIKANGDSLTQLTSSSSHQRPSWSPDGTRIAFRSGGIKILTLATGAQTTVLTSGDFPTWVGPSTIFFQTSAPAGRNWDYYFETVDTAGTMRNTVYYRRTSSDCSFNSMNQNGTLILFGARPFNLSERSQIIQVTVSTSEPSQLTSEGGDYPAWSPDGMKVVYTSTAKGDGGLWIMNADGSGKRRLTQP